MFLSDLLRLVAKPETMTSREQAGIGDTCQLMLHLLMHVTTWIVNRS
jgi:hypothetical protein